MDYDVILLIVSVMIIAIWLWMARLVIKRHKEDAAAPVLVVEATILEKCRVRKFFANFESEYLSNREKLKWFDAVKDTITKVIDDYFSTVIKKD